jgi:hypothetical protein
MPFIISTASRKKFLSQINSQWVLTEDKNKAYEFQGRELAEGYKYYAGEDGIILEKAVK